MQRDWFTLWRPELEPRQLNFITSTIYGARVVVVCLWAVDRCLRFLDYAYNIADPPGFAREVLLHKSLVWNNVVYHFIPPFPTTSAKLTHCPLTLLPPHS